MPKKIPIPNELDTHELTVQNRKFNEILDSAGLGSWDWWVQLGKVTLDKRWSQILGLTQTETPLLFRDWESRIHPDDIEMRRADINAHLEDKKIAYENIHRIKHSDGTWIWILDRGKVIERTVDGKPIRFIGTYLDITKYKELEFLSSNIQKMANIGGWELDVATQITRWTEQTYEIHKIPINTPIHKVKAINFYAEHERHKISQYVTDCIGGKPYRDILEFYDANGKHKWVEVTGEPVYNSEGYIYKIQGTFQDVTKRVETEQKAEQNRIKSIHTARLATLGEMASGIAHEINNPLSIVKAYASNLKDSIETGNSIDLNKLDSIKIIDSTIDRIAKIVRGLLTFARDADHDAMILTDLNKVILDTLDLCRERFKRKGIDLRLNIMGLHYTICRPTQISQILLNLLSNAYDAIENLDTKWIEIQISSSAISMKIFITDSGTGISNTINDKIMNPFFTTKSVGKGTGLGLSISKGLAESHGGSLCLDKKHKNTRFILEIPKMTKTKLKAPNMPTLFTDQKKIETIINR